MYKENGVKEQHLTYPGSCAKGSAMSSRAFSYLLFGTSVLAFNSKPILEGGVI